MIIVLMGPPGAGKGTQARHIVDKYNVTHLATGDMFREKIASGDDVGVKIKEMVESGRLVPDELTIQMIADRIEQPDCKNGFILDGFPRTVEQAEGLDMMLKEHGLFMDGALEIKVDDNALVDRISGRFSCSDCGEGYHDDFKPSAVSDICDCCGGEHKFVRRADDTAEKVKTRLGIYHEQTAPILPFYEQRNMLHTVDGMGSMEDVKINIFSVLDGLEDSNCDLHDSKEYGDVRCNYKK